MGRCRCQCQKNLLLMKLLPIPLSSPLPHVMKEGVVCSFVSVFVFFVSVFVFAYHWMEKMVESVEERT
jgi:hypothetical protein